MLAMYMRLSLADKEQVAESGRSGSIEGQDLILTEYAENHPELCEGGIRRFADDGFSGTSMDRPQLQEMIRQCLDGRVTCVLVKDFSRLGRSYLDVGYLVQELFPKLGVRLIAVSDGYDSGLQEAGGEGELFLGITNIVNAAYSADISAKRRAADAASWKRGDFTSGNAPYGYVFDKSARGNLSIDPIGSVHIVRLFELACEGLRTSKIAEVLNEEGVPTPYANAIRLGKKGFRKPKKDEWTPAKVHTVLTNRAYEGALVGGKTKVMGVGRAAPTVKTAENDRIVVEDAHDAIVSHEVFAKAQLVTYKKPPRAKPNAEQGLFSELVRCPSCGWLARTKRSRSGKPIGYEVNCECGQDAFISEDELQEVLGNILRIRIETEGMAVKRLRKSLTANGKKIAGLERELSISDAKCRSIKSKGLEVYEDYAAGKTDRAEYERRRDEVANRLEKQKKESDRISVEIELLEKEAKDLERQCAEGRCYLPLTSDLATELMKHVYLNSDGSIDINFRITDMLERSGESWDWSAEFAH